MRTQPNARASRHEIFAHLRALLGDEAIQVAQDVATLAINGQNERALDLLKSYDRKIGDVGLHWFEEKRQLGVYRPFFYVLLPLRSSREPQENSRDIIHHACAYLEELLKRLVRLNLIERLKDSSAARLPLGALAKKIRKKASEQFPVALMDELDWLAQSVYDFAKHIYNFEEQASPPEHYFELDESLAVYFIARKIGLELEQRSGKTIAQLQDENQT